MTMPTTALSNGQIMPLAQQIAQASVMGMLQLPTDASGWQNTIDQFMGGNSPVPGTTAPQVTQSRASNPSTPEEQSVSGNTSQFLDAIKQHESGGNYQAFNAAGGASGAYQFIQSTWNSQATAAGYGQYADAPASSAPAAVQDAVAAHMANGYYKQYGNWSDAAQAWYDPADVGKNVVPAPGAGNTETVTGYGQQITQAMAQSSGVQPSGVQLVDPNGTRGATGVVATAQSQIGVPYQWGGEAAGKNFDCSGLVQWAYGQMGVQLPRVAQNQYDATQKLPTGQQLDPGDLVFFGQGTQNITHVGIYIGNGQMVDAPHSGADVRTESIHWADYVGATRPSDPTGQSFQSQPTSPTAPQSQPTPNLDMTNYGVVLQQVLQQLQHYAIQGPTQ